MARPKTDNVAIYFRAPKVILERAREHADEQGMTMPELLRHALRKEVLPARR